MTEHSFLLPSSAARWAGQNCTGSPKLEAQFASVVNVDDAQAAAEGSAAHWVVAQMLRGHTWAVGMNTTNGIVVDEEMLEAAEMFYADVCTQCQFDLSKIHVEESLRTDTIHPDNWGTPDVWNFTPAGMGGLLIVPDFKYGHRFVDAFENWQLINYVAKILGLPEFVGLDRREIEVVMSVVQPRNYHPVGPIRRWSVKANELHSYFTILENAAAEAMGPNPQTRVGPQCVDCRGRHACEALHYAADTVADIAGGVVSLELPPHALGVELRMLARAQTLISARVTGLEAQATALLKSGQTVPFFAIEQSRNREEWTKPVPEILALGSMMGVDLAKPPAALTPVQARKAGMDEAVVKGYVIRPPGAMKLVPVETSQAKRTFSP